MNFLEKIHAPQHATLSFEFFPPKNEKAWFTLEETIAALSVLGPDFVSVTDTGAGGKREQTREVCRHILKSTKLPTVAHVTCLGATKDAILEHLDLLHAEGVRSIMALRGDAPKGEVLSPEKGGMRYSGELIELLAKDGRFSIGCACYPDGHPEASSKQADWEILKRKFDQGADFAITQCYFDNRSYIELCQELHRTHPKAPVLPGILPITNWASVKRFCKQCEAYLPQSLFDRLEPLAEDAVACRRAGILFSIEQCKDLLSQCGAPGLHIYSLNRSTAAAEIVTGLNLLGVL